MRLRTYIRMSTEKGQEDSPITQRMLLADWAQRQGHTVVAEHLDEAMTGSLPAVERPAAARLLVDACDKRRDFDGILVIRLDRLCRDAEDRMGVLALLAKHGCKVVTPDGEERMDTPTERMVQRLRAAVDQHEREITGQRIKEHNTARLMQGRVPNGQVPLGYRYDRQTQTVTIDNERAPDAIAVFRYYVASGGNGTAAARTINLLGIRGTRGAAFLTTSVLSIIKNPFYRRCLHYGGRTVPAPETIPELIPPELLAMTDALLEIVKPLPARSRQQDAAYRGILVCAQCGRRLLRAARMIDGTLYVSWYCTGRAIGVCDQVSLSDRRLDRVASLLLSELAAHLQVDMPVTVDEVQTREADKKRTRLRTQRVRWTEMFAEGLIEMEEMRNRITEIDAALRQLEIVPGGPSIVSPQEVRAMLDAIVQRWGDVTQEDRRAFLAAIGAQLTLDSRYDYPVTLTMTTHLLPTPITAAIPYTFHGSRHKVKPRTL